MIKKVLALMLALSSVFLCGCDNSKRIDKAVIIECIIVDKSDYKFIYISDEEKSETVSEKYYSALQYIKNNYAVSPSVYTAVCSNDILKLLEEPKTLEKCTEQIMILEKKDTDISSTLLKMNNNLNKSKKSLLYLPHISKNNGVTGEKVEIMIKK